MNFLEQLEVVFTLLTEAEAKVGIRTDRPDRNVAAALVWSQCYRLASLQADLAGLDHPNNPRRPRSAEASREMTLRIEKAIDETEFLVSWFATRASKELLPDASVFTDEQTRQAEGKILEDQEILKLAGIELEDLKDALTLEKARAEDAQKFRNEIVEENKKGIEARIKRALETTPKWSPNDLAPMTAMAIFGRILTKVAGDGSLKNPGYRNRAIVKLARAFLPRHQRELAAQIRLLTKAAELADEGVEEARAAFESSDFEPMRAAGMREDAAPQEEVND